jgi:hypothetical protein
MLLAARIAASWGGMKGGTAEEVAEAGRAAEEAEDEPEKLMTARILAAARRPREEQAAVAVKGRGGG